MDSLKKAIIVHYIYGITKGDIKEKFNLENVKKNFLDFGIDVQKDEEPALSNLCKTLLAEFNLVKKQGQGAIESLLVTKYPFPKTSSEKKPVVLDIESGSDNEIDIPLVKKRTRKAKAEPKFSTPGQRYATPNELDSLRLYYESLFKENPSSKLAKTWLIEHGIPLPNQYDIEEEDVEEVKQVDDEAFKQTRMNYEYLWTKKQLPFARDWLVERGLPVPTPEGTVAKSSPIETPKKSKSKSSPKPKKEKVSLTDKLFFFHKSANKPAGEGANEFVQNPQKYRELNKIKNWRHSLDNFDMCPFKWTNPINKETYTYNTIEHALIAAKFLTYGYDDVAYRFTIESKDPIGLGNGSMAYDYRNVVDPFVGTGHSDTEDYIEEDGTPASYAGHFAMSHAKLLKKVTEFLEEYEDVTAEAVLKNLTGPFQEERLTENRLPEIQKIIDDYNKYGPAKIEERKSTNNSKYKWNKVKKQMLEQIAEAKFTQCSDARQVLLLTNDAELYRIVLRQKPQHFDHLERIRAKLSSNKIKTEKDIDAKEIDSILSDVESGSESEQGLDIESASELDIESASDLELEQISNQRLRQKIFELAKEVDQDELDVTYVLSYMNEFEPNSLSEDRKDEIQQIINEAFGTQDEEAFVQNEVIPVIEDEPVREILPSFDLKEAVFAVLDNYRDEEWTVSKLKKQIIEDYYLPENAMAGKKDEINSYYMEYMTRESFITQRVQQLKTKLEQEGNQITEELMDHLRYQALRMWEQYISTVEQKAELEIEEIEEKVPLETVEVEISEPSTAELQEKVSQVLSEMLLTLTLDEITVNKIRRELESIYGMKLKHRNEEIGQLVKIALELFQNDIQSEEQEDQLAGEITLEVDNPIENEVSKAIAKSVKKKLQKSKGDKVVVTRGKKDNKMDQKLKLPQEEADRYMRREILRDEANSLNGDIDVWRSKIAQLQSSLYMINPEYTKVAEVGVEFKEAVDQMKEQPKMIINPAIQGKIEELVQNIDKAKARLADLAKEIQDLGAFPNLYGYIENINQKYNYLKKIADLKQEIMDLQVNIPEGEEERQKLVEELVSKRKKVELLEAKVLPPSDKKDFRSQILSVQKIKDPLNLAQYKLQTTLTPLNVKNLPYIAFLSYYATSFMIPLEDPTLSQIYSNYNRLGNKFKQQFSALSIQDRLKYIEHLFQNIDFKKAVKDMSMTNFVSISIPNDLSNWIEGRECKENREKEIKDEFEYNLKYYLDSFDQNEIIDRILKRVYGECAIPNVDTTTIMNELKKLIITKDEKDIASSLHTYQYNKLKELYASYKSLDKIDREDQYIIQQEHDKIFPIFVPPKTTISQGVMKMAESFPISYYIRGTQGTKLKNMLKVFQEKRNRDIIYKVMETIEEEISNKKISKENRQQTELDAIKSLIEAGEINKTIGNFMLNFIDLYGSLSELPTKKYKIANMFRFKSILDLPEKLRNEAINHLEPMLREIEEKKEASQRERRAKTNALSMLQIELNKPVVDKIEVARLVNLLGQKEEVSARLMNIVDKDEWRNIFVMLQQVGVNFEQSLKDVEIPSDQKRYIIKLFKEGKWQEIFSNFKIIGQENVAKLLLALNVEESVVDRIVKLVEDGSSLKEIRQILDKIKPNLSSQVKNPLEYKGYRRAVRMANLPKYENEIEKIRKTFPIMTQPIKDIMDLYLFRPWYNTTSKFKTGFNYFIQDAKNREKYELDEKTQLMFGQRIPVKTENEESLYYYIPTSLFWKVFCSNNFTVNDSKYVCNKDMIMSTMTSLGGDKHTFNLGLYRKTKPTKLVKKAMEAEEKVQQPAWDAEEDVWDAYHAKVNKKKELEYGVFGIYNKDTQKWETKVLNNKDLEFTYEFTVFDEKDYQLQCEWMSNNYHKNLIKFQTIARTNLAKDTNLRNIAQSIVKSEIKSCLDTINQKEGYIKIKKDFPEHIERVARELEKAIYALAQDGTGTQKPLYVYMRLFSELLFFIDNKSPAYDYVEYFRMLMFGSNEKAYEKILKMSLPEKFPDIYLVLNKQKFFTIYQEYINTITNYFVAQVINTAFGSEVNVNPKRIYTPSDMLSAEFRDPAFNLQKVIFENGQLSTFDVEKYRNLCINQDYVQEPYFMSKTFTKEKDSKEFYCVSREQIIDVLDGVSFVQYKAPNQSQQTGLRAIVDQLLVELRSNLFEDVPSDEVLQSIDQIGNGKLELVRTLPEQYKVRIDIELVKLGIAFELPKSVIDDINIFFPEDQTEKNLFRRMTILRREINRYVRENLGFYLFVKDSYEQGEQIPMNAFQIYTYIEDYLGSKLTQNEKDLVIETAMSEAMIQYLAIIQQLATDYYAKNKQFFDEQLQMEYMERLRKYIVKNKNFVEDREIRITLLQGLFDYIQQEYGYLPQYVKEGIVDFVSENLFKPESIEESRIDNANVDFYGKCHSCGIVLSSRYLSHKLEEKDPLEVRFCSKECFNQVDDDQKVPSPDELREIIKNSNIVKLIAPFMTLPELKAEVARLKIKVDFDKLSYNDIYGTLLLNKSYSIPTKILLDRKPSLQSLAREYSIDTNLDVNVMYALLREKEEFNLLFGRQVNILLNPQAVLTIKTKAIKKFESFLDECPRVDMATANQFIKDYARNNAYRISDFDFQKDLFDPFFREFSSCRELIYSIKELAKGKRISFAIMTLSSILDIVTNPNYQVVKDFYNDTYADNEEQKIKSKYEKFLIEGKYDKFVKLLEKVKEKAKKGNAFDKIEKRIEMFDDVSKIKLKGATLPEKVQSLLFELDKIKNTALVRTMNVSRAHKANYTTELTSVHNYKSLLMKIATKFIEQVMEKYRKDFRGEDDTLTDLKVVAQQKKQKTSNQRRLEIRLDNYQNILNNLKEQLVKGGSNNLQKKHDDLMKDIQKLTKELEEEKSRGKKTKTEQTFSPSANIPKTTAPAKTGFMTFSQRKAQASKKQEEEKKEEVQSATQALQTELMNFQAQEKNKKILEEKLDAYMKKVFPMLMTAEEKALEVQKKNEKLARMLEIEDEEKGAEIINELVRKEEIKMVENMVDKLDTNEEEDLEIIFDEDELIQDLEASSQEKARAEYGDIEDQLDEFEQRAENVRPEEQEHYGFKEADDDAYDIEEEEFEGYEERESEPEDGGDDWLY